MSIRILSEAPARFQKQLRHWRALQFSPFYLCWVQQANLFALEPMLLDFVSGIRVLSRAPARLQQQLRHLRALQYSSFYPCRIQQAIVLAFEFVLLDLVSEYPHLV